MLQKCCTCSQALRARYSSSVIPPTEGLQDYPLIQSKISPPTEFNKQTDYDSDKLSEKNQNIHASYFRRLSLPCRKASKRSSLRTSSQQTSSQQLPAPLTFTHPFLIVLQCSFWGEGTRECHQFSFLSEHSVARNAVQAV